MLSAGAHKDTLRLKSHAVQDVAAPAYDYWRTLFAEEHGQSKSGLVGHQVAYGPNLHHLHSDVDMSHVELWQLAWPT